MRTITIFLLLTAISLLNNRIEAQSTASYSYLTNCYKDAVIDSFDTEIDGIGTVMIFNYSSDSTETGLDYYSIPKSKRNKSTSKLAGLAADRHIQTWKNNSRIERKDSYQVGQTSIIDLRLHMLIENIYLQVIVICEGNRIYEIMCFKDTNEKIFFDDLLGRIKERKCIR